VGLVQSTEGLKRKETGGLGGEGGSRGQGGEMTQTILVYTYEYMNKEKKEKKD
jgi:hypothetical protein